MVQGFKKERVKMGNSKEEYIQKLAQKSRTDKHELIEECLIHYKVCGTKDLMAEQLKEFCSIKGL